MSINETIFASSPSVSFLIKPVEFNHTGLTDKIPKNSATPSSSAIAKQHIKNNNFIIFTRRHRITRVSIGYVKARITIGIVCHLVYEDLCNVFVSCDEISDRCFRTSWYANQKKNKIISILNFFIILTQRLRVKIKKKQKRKQNQNYRIFPSWQRFTKREGHCPRKLLSCQNSACGTCFNRTLPSFEASLYKLSPTISFSHKFLRIPYVKSLCTVTAIAKWVQSEPPRDPSKNQ